MSRILRFWKICPAQWFSHHRLRAFFPFRLIPAVAKTRNAVCQLENSLVAVMGIGTYAVAVFWLLITFNLGVAGSPSLGERDLSIADIPSCGITCILLNVPKSPCKLDDYACICNDLELGQRMGACVVANCTMADNLETARVNKQLCNLSDESKTNTVRTYTITVYVIAIFVVSLRVASRLLSGRLAWNDAPIVAAVVLAAVPIGTVLAMASLGFGEHVWNLEDDRLLPILRYFYIAWSTYVVILCLIKTSLVLFYLEIFVTRPFKIMGWVVFGYIIINSLIIFLLTVFACSPVESFWNRDLNIGHVQCMDIQMLGYANSISAIVQDVILLVLPLFFIKNLQMKRYNKIAVGLMFSIGSFGCITTIVRLQTLLMFKVTFDPTWDYVPIVIWTELEITACFLCVCLPSIRVLIMRLIPPSMKDWLSKATITSKHKESSAANPKHSQPPKPSSWRRPSAWVGISSEEESEHKGRVEKDKSTPSTPGHSLRSPVIPHSKFSPAPYPLQDLKSPARLCEHEKYEMSDFRSHKTPKEQPQVAANRASCKSCGGNSERITALPTIGSLPDGSYSSEDLSYLGRPQTGENLV
ncbi:hypothetical protein B0J11DRAFT_529483 [Dendryphion nanum]|uniref:CFEM domain-containing protein n=1 Tax=Dendryphion nanum TaxID=256645 RepID=A0A9P9DR93_9PLEO|nr:hypothetical protein B0J11DRAFT_529483 [Dendryphion nanum]